MRIATIIIGFLLGLVMTIQATLLYAVGNAINEADNTVVTDSEVGAFAVAIVVVLLWLIAIAFAYPFPWVSVVSFGIAALLGFAISGDYPDMGVWGFISIILGVMSYFGVREKKRKNKESQEMKAALLAIQQNTAASSTQPS